MNNKQININNKIIEGKVIADISAECFYTYLTIRKFELAYEDKSVFSIDLLYKTIKDSIGKYNRNFTIDKIRDYIIKLKKYNLISYKYKSLQDEKEYRIIELNELPNMGSGYTFTSLDLNIIDVIVKKLGVKELMVWICLCKFTNADQITVSYHTMSKWLGYDKDTCNRYGFALESEGFICNEKGRTMAKGKNKEQHACNSFKICDKADNLDEFKSIYQDKIDKHKLTRVKRRLQNKKFKVSKNELENHKELIEQMTEEELAEFNNLKEIHIAYALEYLCINKYAELNKRLEEAKAIETKIEVEEEVTTAQELVIEEMEKLEKNNLYEKNEFYEKVKEIRKKSNPKQIEKVVVVKPKDNWGESEEELKERTQFKEEVKTIDLNKEAELKAKDTIAELKKYIEVNAILERDIRKYYQKDTGDRNMEDCFNFLNNICSEISFYRRLVELDSF